MKWNRFTLKTKTEAEDIVICTLAEVGIEGVEIQDKQPLTDEDKAQMFVDIMPEGPADDGIAYLNFYLEEDADTEAILKDVKAALEDLRSFVDIGEATITESQTEDKDWINNWKQYFKPLCVGEKLLIKPSWEKVAEGEKRKILEIDPASSFGTGQHNTTQLCLELVEKNLHDGDRILDLGCGSGILSIGALLLGAESATAVDVDENSVKIAKENAEKNHISAEKYTAYCGNIIDDKALVEQIGTGYDLLCANIVADVLIGMSGIFGGFIKDGGTLIVSGIIDQRKDEVLDRLKADGFELIEIREKEDWVAASFRK